MPVLIGRQSNTHLAAIREKNEALRSHPAAPVFLYDRGCILMALGDFVRAESAWETFIATVPAEEAVILTGAFGQKLKAALFQNEPNHFRTAVDEYSASPLSAALKSRCLDQLACVPLMEDRSDLFEQGEFCARKALEIAPGQLTVMGTLGSILVELGRVGEGELLLRQCYDRSIAVPDKGICALYLARIAEARGELTVANKLLKESLILHPEPWLVAKVKAAQEGLRRRANHPVSLS